jgi:hypothetical protein
VEALAEVAGDVRGAMKQKVAHNGIEKGLERCTFLGVGECVDRVGV